VPTDTYNRNDPRVGRLLVVAKILRANFFAPFPKTSRSPPLSISDSRLTFNASQ